jgi:hypothetical protein
MLFACGSRKQLIDSLTFHPPDGWMGGPIRGTDDVETWQDPSPHHGILTLSSESPLVEAGLASRMLVENGGKLVAQREMTLCGTQPSTYWKIVKPGAGGRESFTSEIVVSKAPRAMYEATYLYQTDTPPNPQAQAALSELCSAGR